MKLITLCFAMAISAMSIGQQAIGVWRNHLPYDEMIEIAVGTDVIFGATPYSVVRYSLTDNSIEVFDKTTGLAESNVTAIQYSDENKIAVVGYGNGNVDLIIGMSVINVNDIEQSSFVGDKSINSIKFRGDKAYLATGFGIVEINLERREVADTWFINGQNDVIAINDIIFDDSYWYASTESGIYRADVNNDFLANFQNWTQLSNLPISQANYTDLTFFGPDQLLVLEPNETESAIWRLDIGQDTWDYLPGFESGLYYSIDANDEQLIVTTFQLTERFNLALESLGAKFSVQGIVTDPRDATIAANNDIWIASRRGGLLAWLGQGDEVAIGITGPDSNNARRIDAFNDNIWVAGGGVDVIWANRFEKDGFFGLVNDQWNIIPPPEGENGLGSVNDVMDAAVDPTNNSRVFFGSWEEGLIEVRNGQFQTIYNQDNSALKVRTGTEDFVGVAGVDFDVDGNLWITNTFSPNPLVLLTAGGTFVPMTFGNVVDEETLVGDIMVASNNYIWMILPRGNGLVVRDVGETIADPSDDNFRRLINEEGQGGLPTNEIFCIEEDIDGEVWVGTEQGIAVFYAPQSIFNSENFDAQQILITQDGNVQILLETEEVTCIEIDGANRKWVGTRGSGAFLFSPDGLEQIAHFTESNSPLLSNNVSDIALNQRNGEVFFATSLGISSYQGTATNFDQDIEEITVFPNPIDPGYDGVITIDGLAYQSDVKIADLAGNAVFSGTSSGGRLVWDGTNFNGDKVSTGIYLVFASRDDGSATNVAKIAIVR
ncbi:MAG: hypothetical protein HRT74_03810 [Flavobacteriales bacterium]|nr:hypothetical protein [Flavobacteriales bacterium]